MEDWNGKFELVDPRLITVDHRYQRDEKPALIAAIAANPDWAAFGALSLYRRDGGVLVCVDGQQRLRGILESEDPPRRVPAVIQEKASPEREAKTFAAINIARRAVDAFEKHKALIVAKTPTALAIERAVDKAGFSIAAPGRTPAGAHDVMAVSALYAIHGQLGEEGVVQVLVQARDAWPDDRNGVSAHMLRGIANVIIDQGESYNRAKVTAALARSTPHAILRKSEELKFDFGGSRQKNVRRAIKTLCKI
jgi:hypothetical protein